MLAGRKLRQQQRPQHSKLPFLVTVGPFAATAAYDVGSAAV